ncbi:MAG: hypothetical protein DMG32_17670, partial [Acidobacteria bacterium]
MVRKVFAATLLFSALSAAGCKHDAPPAADVWAVVNGDQIHRAEAQKYYKSRLNPQAPTPSQEEALSLTLNVLDELINNDILIQRARKLGLEATDGEVEDKYTYRVAQILVTPHKDPQLHNRKNDDATTDVEARRKSAALLQQLANGADFAQLAMDYSEDPATASSGGDLGYIPESSLNQSDPALKRAVVVLKVGEVSPIIPLKDGYHILKLMAKEAPGQRQLSDPQVQQSIRDTLRNRKEQLLRAAYMAEARDGAKVTNFLAEQVTESNGKLPEIPKFGSSALAPAPAGAPSPASTP